MASADYNLPDRIVEFIEQFLKWIGVSTVKIQEILQHLANGVCKAEFVGFFQQLGFSPNLIQLILDFIDLVASSFF